MHSSNDHRGVEIHTSICLCDACARPPTMCGLVYVLAVKGRVQRPVCACSYRVTYDAPCAVRMALCHPSLAAEAGHKASR
eukprot:364510-Chlamydomonas_euryale.AAC.4